jgi:LytS/YehU family sensor histidine kinase
VHSAIDQDPVLGKQILEHLIRYLRGTLSRTRSVHYALSDERDLIDSLLSIASIRLGPRLRSSLNIPNSPRMIVGNPGARLQYGNLYLIDHREWL